MVEQETFNLKAVGSNPTAPIMKVVTGDEYPNDRWVVIDNDGNVLFDPVLAFEDTDNIKVCNVWANKPKYRNALERKFLDSQS